MLEMQHAGRCEKKKKKETEGDEGDEEEGESERRGEGRSNMVKKEYVALIPYSSTPFTSHPCSTINFTYLNLFFLLL